jgi:hypothetical protein
MSLAVTLGGRTSSPVRGVKRHGREDVRGVPAPTVVAAAFGI